MKKTPPVFVFGQPLSATATTAAGGPLTPAAPLAAPDATNMMGDRNGARPPGGQELTDAELITDHRSPITPSGPEGQYYGGAENVGNPDYLIDPVTGKCPFELRQDAASQAGNVAVNKRSGEALAAIQSAPDAWLVFRTAQIYADEYDGEPHVISGFDLPNPSPVLLSLAATLAPALESTGSAPPTLLTSLRAISEREVARPGWPSGALGKQTSRDIRAAIDFALVNMALPTPPPPPTAASIIAEVMAFHRAQDERLLTLMATLPGGDPDRLVAHNARQKIKATTLALAALIA